MKSDLCARRARLAGFAMCISRMHWPGEQSTLAIGEGRILHKIAEGKTRADHKARTTFPPLRPKATGEGSSPGGALTNWRD